MILSLIEILEKQTKLSYEGVISRFLDSDVFDVTSFSEDNYQKETKIILEIRPPSFFIDYNTTRIEGSIYSQQGLTTIRLKFFPKWFIFGFIILWILLSAFMIIIFDYKNNNNIIQFLGFSIIWNLIPFLLGRLKLYWQKKKIERWINKKIKNIA